MFNPHIPSEYSSTNISRKSIGLDCIVVGRLREMGIFCRLVIQQHRGFDLLATTLVDPAASITSSGVAGELMIYLATAAGTISGRRYDQ